MSEPFVLEHWRSRALVAEKELESARSVLAALRGFLQTYEEKPRDGWSTETMRAVGEKYTKLRERQREHDSEYWTKEHAVRAVVEALAGDDDEVVS